MTRRPPPFFLKPLLLILIPLSLTLYLRQSLSIPISAAGLLDALAFSVLFVLVQLKLTRPGNSPAAKWSGVVVFLLTLLIYLGTLFHYRFFYSWIQLDSLRQTGNLGELKGALWALLRWGDLALAGLCAIFFAKSRKLEFSAPPRLSLRTGLALILLLSTQLLLIGDNVNYANNHPFFYLFRQKGFQVYNSFKTAQTTQAVEKIIPNLNPINPLLYEFEGSKEYPLQKIPRQPQGGESRRFNVVLIVLESVRAFESGAYGASPSYTPQFDALAKKGTLLRTYYSNATQTVRSEFALLSSYLPHVFGSPVYSQFPNVGIKTLPEILKANGYSTFWFSGFSPFYGNKQGFLAKNGIDHFYSNPPEPVNRLGWGPSDEDIFDYALATLDKKEEPFFAEIMTLSNHFPFNFKYPTSSQTPEAPAGSPGLLKNYLNGVFYTDHALGEFFKKAKEKPWFQNTLFVITADTGIWIFPSESKTREDKILRQEIYYRIPGLILSPEKNLPTEITSPASQIDIAPTVLDILGIYEKNSFLGTSLLSETSNPREIFMTREDRWNYRREGLYFYDVGPEVFKEHFPKSKTAILRSEFEHFGFTTDKDLLFNDDPSSVSPISNEAFQIVQNRIEEALNIFTFLLSSDRIFEEDAQEKPAGEMDFTPFEGERPEFITHAGGAFEGKIYTNSLEALNHNYEQGARVFEVDMAKTTDNVLVLSHDWPTPTEAAMSLADFKEAGRKENLTFLTVGEFLDWMLEKPDTFLVTDIKEPSYMKILDEIQKAFPSLRERVIPQIYFLEDVSFVKAMGYDKVLFTLYQSRISPAELIEAPELNLLFGVVMPYDAVEKTNIAFRLKKKGVFVYAHTVNDPEKRDRLRKKGASGFFIDFQPKSEENTRINY